MKYLVLRRHMRTPSPINANTGNNAGFSRSTDEVVAALRDHLEDSRSVLNDSLVFTIGDNIDFRLSHGGCHRQGDPLVLRRPY